MTADVPGDWKTEVISPIFKKVDHEDFANYLPVSLTSVVCKAFDWILKRVIFSVFNVTQWTMGTLV